MPKIKKEDNLEQNLKLEFKDYLSYPWRSLKVYWSISRMNLIGKIIALALGTVGTILTAYYTGLILEALIKVAQTNNTDSKIYILLSIRLLIEIIVTSSSSLNVLLERGIMYKWDLWGTISKADACANQDADFFEDRDNQKMLNKIDRKGPFVIGDLSESIIYLFFDVFKILLIISIVIKISWWASLVITIATIPRILTRIKLSKTQYGIWQANGDDYHFHYKTIGLFSYYESLREIRLYGLTDRLLHKFAKNNMLKFINAQTKVIKSAFSLQALTDAIYVIILSLISLYLVTLVAKGKISIAQFSFYGSILAQFSGSLSNIGSIISSIDDNTRYAKDLFKLLDSKPKITTKNNAITLPKNDIPSIEFRNVSYRYKSNKKLILKDFNLKIMPGEHVALVGENGAGKSTIIKLLLRIYDVSEGEILINGINIKDVDLNSWWRHVGVLFQDFNKYPLNIKMNIEFGRVNSKSNSKNINNSVKMADLDKMLIQLPSGLNTILDNSFEEGVEPSGGQWQRVALARAFYRNSNVLILDEPTAAVDANAEYTIFNNIFKHYQNKTAIIISHRFSTVRRASRIIVIAKGKIIEEGTHAKLINNNKLYAEMFNKQAEGYKE